MNLPSTKVRELLWHMTIVGVVPRLCKPLVSINQVLNGGFVISLL